MSDADAGGQQSKPEGIRQQCSMTYWWPKLQSTGVPVPQTVRVATEGVEAMTEKGFDEEDSREAVKYLWMRERRKAKERGHDA